MVISSVGQSGAAAQASASTSSKASSSAEATESTSASKKDTAVVSQKAKDLAAAKAGKAFQEEANESMAAKLQEASGA